MRMMCTKNEWMNEWMVACCQVMDKVLQRPTIFRWGRFFEGNATFSFPLVLLIIISHASTRFVSYRRMRYSLQSWMLPLGSHMFIFIFIFRFRFRFHFHFQQEDSLPCLLCFRSFTHIWVFCHICLIHSFVHSSLPVLGDGYTLAFLILLGVWEGYLLPGKVGKEAVGGRSRVFTG